MLLLILRRIALDKADVGAHLISVIPEVNELADLVFIMRLMRRKHCDDWVSTYPVERVCITGNNAF